MTALWQREGEEVKCGGTGWERKGEERKRRLKRKEAGS